MWFLDPKVAENILKVEKEGFKPTAAQEEEFKALGFDSQDGSVPRIMSIAGDTAEIAIKGILTPSPDIMAMFMGGGNTTYSEIISAIASAEQNKEIKNIVLAIDSPGGSTDGLFPALNAVDFAKKPVKAVVSNKATSAAYAIAAQADEIVALDELTHVGSIGILVRAHTDDNIVSITSSKAPKKSPDLKTAEGKAELQKTLDGFHDAFVATIARGRDVTPEEVNRDFGQGAVVLAEEALEKGMIDGISNPVIKSSATSQKNASIAPSITENFKKTAQVNKKIEASNSTKQTEVIAMNLEEMKAQHGSLYDQIVAIGKAEGVEDGIAKERVRINAHLILGQSSGDMDTATKAIKDGSDCDDSFRSTYLAAQMNKGSVTAREDDNPGAIDGADTEVTADSKDLELAAAVALKLGVPAPVAGGVS